MSILQTETFINNSQPYYALLSPDDAVDRSRGLYPDADEYSAFLQRGLQAMQQLTPGRVSSRVLSRESWVTPDSALPTRDSRLSTFPIFAVTHTDGERTH